MKIRLINGYREGTEIEVTDERYIAGIHWIGGKVLNEEDPTPGFHMELGGQWIEGRDYEVIEE